MRRGAVGGRRSSCEEAPGQAGVGWPSDDASLLRFEAGLAGDAVPCLDPVDDHVSASAAGGFVAAGVMRDRRMAEPVVLSHFVTPSSSVCRSCQLMRYFGTDDLPMSLMSFEKWWISHKQCVFFANHHFFLQSAYALVGALEAF